MRVRFTGYQWPKDAPRPRAVTVTLLDAHTERVIPVSAEFDALDFHGDWRLNVFSRVAALLSERVPGLIGAHPDMDPGSHQSKRGLCCLYNGLEVNMDPRSGYVFPCDTPEDLGWWERAVAKCLEQLARLGLRTDGLHESVIADFVWPEGSGEVDKDNTVARVLAVRGDKR